MPAAARHGWAAAGVAALIAGATVLAPSASADTVDDAFLSALNRAGVQTTNPVDTVALGKQVCPMLVQPGKDFAKVVTSVRNDGVPPDVAAFFAGIAIQMYCPQMMSSIGNGTFLQWLQTARLR
jgi:Protein of unknown function (DUF732)